MGTTGKTVLWLCSAVLVACGGGGGGGGDQPKSDELGQLVFYDLSPSAFLSSLPKFLIASATEIGHVGDSAALRFTAQVGTPFHGGTSATVGVPVTVVSHQRAHAMTPFGLCEQEVTANVTFVRSDGAEDDLGFTVELAPTARHRRPVTSSYSYFGCSVAIEGVALLVGARGALNVHGRHGGMGRFYELQTGGSALVNFDAHGDSAGFGSGDLAGYSVAVTKDWGFVGAPGTDTEELVPGGGIITRVDAGQVLVFTVDWGDVTPVGDPPTMGQRMQLRTSDAQQDSYFGAAVAATDVRLVVGAPRRDHDLHADAGAAYVFTVHTTADVPTEEAKLLPFQPADMTRYGGGPDDRFGSTVAIDGDTIVVGAPKADGAGGTSGAAYVFVRRSGTWEPQQKLIASDGASADEFGTSVAVEGDTIVVGAPRYTVSASSVGAAYVFRRSAGVWTEHQHLEPAGDRAQQRLGSAVAIRLDRIAVGAPGDFNRGLGGAGAVFVFEVDPQPGGMGSWHEAAKLVAPLPDSLDLFGTAVDLGPSNVIVGAPGDSIPGAAYGGAIYLY